MEDSVEVCLYSSPRTTDSDSTYTKKNPTFEDENGMVFDIIKKVCDDVKRDYMNDVNATPEILVSNLKESIEEFNAIQEECIKHLENARSAYNGSNMLEQLCLKFKHVNDKAVAYVSKQIIHPTINKNMLQSTSQNDEKRILWNWVNSDATCSHQFIFEWKEVRVSKIDFQSLFFGEFVVSPVIDVWSSLLNNINKGRSQCDKNRFFCFTQNTVGVIDATKKIPEDKMYYIFAENMEYVFGLFGASLDNIDLIFFPMLILNQHYVVCYNLEEPSLEILDSKQSEKTIGSLYGDQITLLHRYFCRFVDERGHKKAVAIRYILPERLKMSWQTKYNDVDCGVFAILHMESYMGGGPGTWVTNMCAESYKQMIQLNDLRIRYTCSALSSDYNEKRLVLPIEDGVRKTM